MESERALDLEVLPLLPDAGDTGGEVELRRPAGAVRAARVDDHRGHLARARRTVGDGQLGAGDTADLVDHLEHGQ